MPKNDLLAQALERAARRAGEPFIQEHIARAKAKMQKEEAEKKAAEEKSKK